MYKPKPESWFIERVGKRIFRDDQGCDCEHCKEATKNGFIILDEYHAREVAAVDVDYATCGIHSNYRDKH